MRNLFLAAAAMVVLVGARSANSQEVKFRPAIDGIGDAYAPASETGAAVPDGAGFDPVYVRSGRGRVTIESDSTPRAHAVHRKSWVRLFPPKSRPMPPRKRDPSSQ
jgi:hypothetical protein